MMEERVIPYDWLKVTACLGVIVIHVGSRYPGKIRGGGLE